MSGGCGGGNCQCAGRVQDAVASINGVALSQPGETLDETQLRERAWAELLRQEAMRCGALPRRNVLVAPELTDVEHAAIDTMLQAQVPQAVPGDEECRRHYEANKAHFVEGQSVHMRHILFAVTEGVDVERLAARAEQVLREVSPKEATAGVFAQRARELSNCPSGADGGDLGWVGPGDCADELANELFPRANAASGVGLRPRLVHSRYGLHIVEVLQREPGRPLAFEQVRQRIATDLAQRSRATALHQYIRLLAGRARVEGVELEAAQTPLVQ